MAATKLIALHINKGKTLEDRIDYANNPEKTEASDEYKTYKVNDREN